jgi:GNAT superfamily N-acetyltransferase
MTPAFRIRAATQGDMAAIYRLVRALAVYEKLADKMTAGEADLREALFGKQPRIEAALAETQDGRAVGIAIFYENFATFTCTPGFYLEDLYVDEDARGAGIGKALIAWGAARALERGCARYQWVVLDWNKSARDFYRSLGAEETPEWIGVRVSSEALEALAGKAR